MKTHINDNRYSINILATEKIYFREEIKSNASYEGYEL